MSHRKGREREVEEPAMGRDPLADDEEILARTFFGAPESKAAEPRPAVPKRAPAAPVSRAAPKTRARKKARGKAAPAHYRIVSISLYNEDIDRIDALVSALKEAGHSKANRSALIRYAIDTVDISKMPRSY